MRGTNRPLSVAVVGYGYWGPNLVRNFHENEHTKVTTICDVSEAGLAQARRRYPHMETTSDFDAVCEDAAVDLVVIATPINSHFLLASRALQSGKDVFVEKPLCTTLAEATKLEKMALDHGCRVFVDHTYVYNPAVRCLRDVVAGGDFGRPLYYDSVRANLGLFQSDYNVLWDLAPHDLSILDYALNGAVPKVVTCIGSAHYGDVENIAYLTLLYDGGFIAHCHLSWLAPVKMRQVVFAGSEKFVIYNDNEPIERLKIYDKGVSMTGISDGEKSKNRVQYRVGDVYSPFVSSDEALKIEVEHIVSCYRDGSAPLTGIRSGVNMVRILEAAQRSMREGGTPQELSLGEIAEVAS